MLRYQNDSLILLFFLYLASYFLKGISAQSVFSPSAPPSVTTLPTMAATPAQNIFPWSPTAVPTNAPTILPTMAPTKAFVTNVTLAPPPRSISFPDSITLDGTTLLVGDISSTASGRAYLYFGCNSPSSTSCTNSNVTLSGPSSGTGFGINVAFDSKTSIAVIGSNSGNAYVYYDCAPPILTTSNCQNSKRQVLTAGGSAGYDVDVSGSTIITGTNTANGGTVNIYYGCTSPTSTTCTDNNKVTLNAPNGALQFGFSVAIDRTTIVVGAHGSNAGTGAAYVYYGCYSGSTSCVDGMGIALSMRSPIANGLFGYSVSISAYGIAVGAPWTSEYAGAVYVFSGCTSAWSTTCQVSSTKLRGSGASGKQFGYSVALDGPNLVVGSGQDKTLTAYQYSGCPGTSLCSDPNAIPLSASSLNRNSTQFVAISGSTIAVGDSAAVALLYYNVIVPNSIISPPTNQVSRFSTHGITSYGPKNAPDMTFGTVTAVSGSTAVIGAPDQSLAYIYYGCTSLTSTTCPTSPVTLTGPADSNFGFSISMDGTTLVIGSSKYLNNAGAVFIYYGCTDSTSSTCTDANRVMIRGMEQTGFGFAVKISGTTILAAAYNPSAYNGYSYIFYDCSGPTSTSCMGLASSGIALTVPPPSDGLGMNVSLSGSIAVIGGDACYIYYGCTGPKSRTCAGSNYVKIDLTDSYTYKGLTNAFSPTVSGVSISGSKVLIGTKNNAAYLLYGCSTANSVGCSNSSKVSFYGTGGLGSTSGGYFAYWSNSLSVYGSTIAIGAFESGYGTVYLYYGCTSAASTTCTDSNRIALSGSRYGENFGLSVALGSYMMAVGTYMGNKATFFYTTEYELTTSTQIKSGSSKFGQSVASGGWSDAIVVGSPSYQQVNILYNCSSNSSSVCTFGRSTTLSAPRIGSTNFGASVAIDGSTVVVGQPGSYSSPKGFVYIYYGCDAPTSELCVSTVIGTTLQSPVTNSSFGTSVAISGSTVVVGAANSLTYVTGSAYIYYGCFSSSSVTCTSNQRVSLNGTSSSMFGSSVDIDGGTVVIGAPNALSSLGAIYIYYGCTSITSTSCIDSKRVSISGDQTNSLFGSSVSISSSTILVGSPGWMSTGIQNDGSAYVFFGCNSPSSSTCVKSGSLYLQLRGESGGQFGSSVAISGTTLVIVAKQSNKAYVYYACGSISSVYCTDNMRQSLTQLDGFKNAIAISSSNIVAPGSALSSSIYVHYPLIVSESGLIPSITLVGPAVTRNSSSNATKSYTPGDANGAAFGYKISASGSTVVVGTLSSNAYVYYGCSSTQDSCVDAMRTTLTGPPGSFYGFSNSISGSTVVIGSFNSTYIRQGSAYIYYGCESIYSPCTDSNKVTLYGPSIESYFGNSVSVSGSTVVVGAYGVRAAYVYYLCISYQSPLTCNDNQRVTLSGASAAADSFGMVVAVSGSTIVVSAPYVGMVYVYFGCNSVSSTSCKDDFRKVLYTPPGAIYFGQGVSISNSTIAIVAYVPVPTSAPTLEPTSLSTPAPFPTTFGTQRRLDQQDSLDSRFFDAFQAMNEGMTYASLDPNATPERRNLQTQTSYMANVYMYYQCSRASLCSDDNRVLLTSLPASVAWSVGLAISGSTVAVGLFSEATSNTGSVYLFTDCSASPSTSNCNDAHKTVLSGPSSYSSYGNGLALTGSTLFISAPYTGSSRGNVDIYFNVASVNADPSSCSPGYTFDYNSLRCTPCPPNTYNSQGNGGSCIPCAIGFNSSAAATSCSSIKEYSFAVGYTGTTQSYVVPPGIKTVKVSLWGGGGSAGAISLDEVSINSGFAGTGLGGGAGGFTQCYLSVNSGDVLTVLVGGGGEASSLGSGGRGGFGGGASGTVPATGDWMWAIGSGGGRSSIQINGEDVVTAGGGGGGGAYCCNEVGRGGGGGGGLLGGDGSPGSGASQINGGVGRRMYSGTGIPGSMYTGGVCTWGVKTRVSGYQGPIGGGGGGGYWGGAGGSSTGGYKGSGGGGSAFIGGCLQGATIFTSVGETGSNRTNIHATPYGFSSTSMTSDGYINYAGLGGAPNGNPFIGNGFHGLVVLKPTNENPTTAAPSFPPTAQPTDPTSAPTLFPTLSPTLSPTRSPTRAPTLRPTSSRPTSQPTSRPSREPSSQPSMQPSRQPSSHPTSMPIGDPTSMPSSQPSGHPSRQPSRQPTSQPSQEPTRRVSTQVSFNVTHQIRGLTASQIKSDPDVFISAFAKSIGVNPSNVILVGEPVDSVFRRNLEESEWEGDMMDYQHDEVKSSSRLASMSTKLLSRLLATFGIGEGTTRNAEGNIATRSRALDNSIPRSRNLVSPGVLVVTQIVVTAEKLGYSDPTSTFNAISSAISTALSTAMPTSLTSLLNTAYGSSSISISSTAQASSLKSMSLHTAPPSSVPTSAPTCGDGSYGTDAHCGLCPPGTYSTGHTLKCMPCAKGYYNPHYGAKSCELCPYPSYTVLVGQSACNGFNLKFEDTELIICLVVLFVIFVVTVSQAGDKKFAAVVIFLLPTIDVLSDYAYWTTTGFYHPALFALSIASFILPNFVFCWRMAKMEAVPWIITYFPGFLLMGKQRLVWLKARDGRPAVMGEYLSITYNGTTYPLTFDNHDTLVKAILYVLTWIMIMVLQFLYLIAFGLWCCISAVYIVPLFIFGIYLFQCKVLAVGPVWNFYFRLWSGPNAEFAQRKIDVDTGVLNMSLLAHLGNTFPQFVIQITNNTMTQLWTPIAIFSTTLSISYAIAALYRYGYYYLWLGVGLAEIPNEISLGGIIKVKLDPETEEQFATHKLDEIAHKKHLIDKVRKMSVSDHKHVFYEDVPRTELIWSLMINHKTSKEVVHRLYVDLGIWGHESLNELTALQLWNIVELVHDKLHREAILEIACELPAIGAEVKSLLAAFHAEEEARAAEEAAASAKATEDVDHHDETPLQHVLHVGRMSLGGFTEGFTHFIKKTTPNNSSLHLPSLVDQPIAPSGDGEVESAAARALALSSDSQESQSALEMTDFGLSPRGNEHGVSGGLSSNPLEQIDRNYLDNTMPTEDTDVGIDIDDDEDESERYNSSFAPVAPINSQGQGGDTTDSKRV